MRSVVAGITTAPSFIAASSVSHSSSWLPSIRMIRSPRPTPLARNQFATRLERDDISANVQYASEPSLSTIHSARRAPRSVSAATLSKWSSAQLNSVSAGQRKSRTAVS